MPDLTQINFRIDWGYQFLYSRRQYHQEYIWDGSLSCSSGNIDSVHQLRYPIVWFGLGITPEETLLPAPEWKNRTRRGFSGIKVSAHVSNDSVFELKTASGTWQFSAANLQKQGRIVFNVGNKYSHCNVIVTMQNFLWFRLPPRPGVQVWEAKDSNLPTLVDRARTVMARILPGEELCFDLHLPAKSHDELQLCAHIQAMPEGQKEDYRRIEDNYGTSDPAVADEIAVAETLTFEWLDQNNRVLCSSSHYFRHHDVWMQMLEDVWSEFTADNSITQLKLRNTHSRLPLLVSKVSFQRQNRQHLKLSLPTWMLKGESFQAAVFSTKNIAANISFDGKSFPLQLTPGWNEFCLSFANAATNAQVTVTDLEQASSTANVFMVYDLADENIEVKVGADFTTVPHDNSGELDWLLNYFHRTRLGNFIALRSFRGSEMIDSHVDNNLRKRWAEFCRDHRLYLQATNCYDNDILAKYAQNYMHNAGPHEYSGVVYGGDPENLSTDMASAQQNFIDYLKIVVNQIKPLSYQVGLGDASGGQRCAYQAGFDIIRTETMVAHTMHLCSLGRGAAKAFNKKEWGVHIAMQHAKHPYFETHLGQYYLSLFQPWAMGANFFYEEDSLFLQFKEERQAWDDALTKGKRDQTREFFKFVKTHPRQGEMQVNMAYLDGRYAAPFNGFICGPEQDPNYSIWGKFGRTESCWGHRQPEKARQLLDVWMPKYSTHPLRQKFDQRRFFFSGTPFGDFDQLPIEADKTLWNNYNLLINIGWNTMIDEDYNKMLHFVNNGGTLFTAIPEFTTSADRQILNHPTRMPLWNNGDLNELCGVKILGSGSEFSGKVEYLDPDFDRHIDLSRLPNDSFDEDGSCLTARIEMSPKVKVIARDAITHEPLLIEHPCGQGKVYLMTLFAWPGHEKLNTLASATLHCLSERSLGSVFVQDTSAETFWSKRFDAKNNITTLTLLNTDWTSPNNEKSVVVHAGNFTFPTTVTERIAKIITITPNKTIETIDNIIPHLEYIGNDNFKIHTDKTTSLKIHNHNNHTSQIIVVNNQMII